MELVLTATQTNGTPFQGVGETLLLVHHDGTNNITIHAQLPGTTTWVDVSTAAIGRANINASGHWKFDSSIDVMYRLQQAGASSGVGYIVDNRTQSEYFLGYG